MRAIKGKNSGIPIMFLLISILSICFPLFIDVNSAYAQVDTLTFDWSPPELDSAISYYKIYWSIDTSDYVPIGITPDTTYYFVGLIGHTYRVKVSAVNSFDIEGALSEASEDTTLSGVENTSGEKIPKVFSLEQNFPNPFNSTTAIRYQLSAVRGRPSIVTLRVYNVLGEEVKELVDGEKEPGYYMAVWNGRDNWGREVSSGIYYYQLQGGSFIRTRKMIFLK